VLPLEQHPALEMVEICKNVSHVKSIQAMLAKSALAALVCKKWLNSSAAGKW